MRSSDTMDDMKYISIKDAAAQLSVSEQTVRRMVKAGVLPHIRIGKLIRIPQDAIDSPPR